MSRHDDRRRNLQQFTSAFCNIAGVFVAASMKFLAFFLRAKSLPVQRAASSLTIRLDLCAQWRNLFVTILFRIAERGSTLMTQQALERSEPIVAKRSEHHRLDTLTPRERGVFEKLITGASNKEVGRQLGISPRTIEIHRARILKKLGVKSVADLVRMAMRLGIQD
jgi:DNA-binding CsgD family transcriptional regulator